MSVIRIAEFKFDLLKISVCLISISRTDSGHFPCKKEVPSVWLLWTKLDTQGRLLTYMVSSYYGMPDDVSKSEAETFHSLKYLGPKDFIAKQQAELGAFKQFDTIKRQPSEGTFHSVMVPTNVGKVMKPGKTKFAKQDDRKFLEQIEEKPKEW